MRLKIKSRAIGVDVDLTPMIDMTFQLIAFFMFVLNFSDIDQDERIRLPVSELAKPPETAPDHPLTLQLTEQGTVLFAGQELNMPELKARLRRESAVLQRLGTDPSTITMIIRGDAAAATGKVQELMQICQDAQFVKFALRAKQEEKY